MKVVAFGEEAWLVYTDRPLAVAAAIPGSVPGADCVLVRDLSALERLSTPTEPEPGTPITLPASWDGEDLAILQETTGIDIPAVITSTTFTVAFCGFSPGFAYLKGLPARLHVPRRDRPRPRVPAGAIAMAAGYLAVYPNESPGGWHLLGHCDEQLFDPEWPQPALLAPGARVRFA